MFWTPGKRRRSTQGGFATCSASDALWVDNSVGNSNVGGTLMFGNVTALQGLYMMRKYRNISIRFCDTVCI